MTADWDDGNETILRARRHAEKMAHAEQRAVDGGVRTVKWGVQQVHAGYATDEFSDALLDVHIRRLGRLLGEQRRYGDPHVRAAAVESLEDVDAYIRSSERPGPEGLVFEHDTIANRVACGYCAMKRDDLVPKTCAVCRRPARDLRWTHTLALLAHRATYGVGDRAGLGWVHCLAGACRSCVGDAIWPHCESVKAKDGLPWDNYLLAPPIEAEPFAEEMSA